MSETTSKDTRAATGAEEDTRKLYAAPKLRRLGSVRELTFGSAPIATDGVSQRMAM